MTESSLATVLLASTAFLLASATSFATGQPSDTPSSKAQAMVQAGNAFAFDLYRQLAAERRGESLFFSPYSIETALAMTAEGARNKTAAQMAEVLRLPATWRNPNDDDRPWDLAPVHAGLAELARWHRPGGPDGDAAATAELRDSIAELERRLRALTDKIEAGESSAALYKEHREVAAELDLLRQRVDQFELDIANALWCAEAFPFRQDFLSALDDAYGATAFPVDFAGDPESARLRINGWVENRTRERITNLIAPGSITDDTILVLTNAIYFKGNWAEEFDPERTEEADFTRADGARTRVDMMSAPALDARYVELLPDGSVNEPVVNREAFRHEFPPNPDGLQILALPYRGRDLSMIVLLPKRHDGLADLEQAVTSVALDEWTDAMATYGTHVFLPKFRLETSFRLPAALKRMGMTAAFSPGGLTGITDSAEGKKLYISDVVHKAFVDVSETGTEAAAATAVMVGTTSMQMQPPRPEFRADRPFMFAIRHDRTGAILFLGRVSDSPGMK